MTSLRTLFDHSEILLSFLALVALTVLIATLLGRYLQRKITEKSTAHHIDATSFVFLKHMVVATVYFLGFGWALLTLPITSTFAHSLLAGAGATTLILGFASQQLFNNLISGVFLVINRPFKINDVIEFQGCRGTVVEINLNATIILDENSDRVIIPSSLMLNDKIKVIGNV